MGPYGLVIGWHLRHRPKKGSACENTPPTFSGGGISSQCQQFRWCFLLKGKHRESENHKIVERYTQYVSDSDAKTERRLWQILNGHERRLFCWCSYTWFFCTSQYNVYGRQGRCTCFLGSGTIRYRLGIEQRRVDVEILILSLVCGLVAVGGLWLASRDTKPHDDHQHKAV